MCSESAYLLLVFEAVGRFHLFTRKSVRFLAGRILHLLFWEGFIAQQWRAVPWLTSLALAVWLPTHKEDGRQDERGEHDGVSADYQPHDDHGSARVGSDEGQRCERVQQHHQDCSLESVLEREARTCRLVRLDTHVHDKGEGQHTANQRRLEERWALSKASTNARNRRRHSRRTS